MDQPLIVSKVEIDEILRLLPSDEAQRTLSFIDALKVFDRAADKKRCAAEIAARLEPLGYKGLSLKSLYRKLDQFKAVGVWACVDRRVARRVSAQGIVANRLFVEAWQARVLMCRRKVKPAWRALLLDLANEVMIPGIGTWRELYAATYGYRPADGEPCPWSVAAPPPGWSLRNLLMVAPDRFSLAAARVGMGQAKIDFLPTVRMTRVGLRVCQVVEVDDMWYEHMVIFGGNQRPQRVVEFAIMDRLTGHVFGHLAKPVVEAPDGTRKTLKSAWVRYLYHYLLCCVGVPDGGCVIKGEHGTASADDTFAAALASVNAVREANGWKPVVFRAGSIVTEPLAKGLPGVQSKGNPRHKGMIEQMHATLKNYVDAIVFGNIGGGRGVQPHEAIGMAREDAALVRASAALPARAQAALRYNFPTWRAFVLAADEAHRRMDERTDHQLEGWEECGFMVGELRVAGTAHWSAVPRMAALPAERAAQVRALVASGAAEYRERRMSPAEAWTTATKAERLECVPASFAPLILGAELAHTGTVGDKLTVTVRDADTGERYTVAAIVDGKPLPRGAKVQVWVNPMDCGKAYVADLQGRFIGVAKVLPTARADADASVAELQEQLGLRSAALADAKQKLEPVVRARLKQRIDAAATNLAALGVEDPVERLELEERQRGELAGVEPADLEVGAPFEEPGVEAADLDPEVPDEEPQIPHDDFL
ncbi:MAG: hypothetical protein IKA69_06450 [Kiritimatiellae bacterium]|nr:hypothetical protein [Kiritimatiellia bacterium]